MRQGQYVMAGLSRPKDGVASLAYVPAISIHEAKLYPVNRDARHKAGHDRFSGTAPRRSASHPFSSDVTVRP